MKIDPNAPAYPSHGTMGEVVHTGMPIRLYLAAQIAAGLAYAAAPDYSTGRCNAAIVERAYVLADALIAAFNEESK